MLINIKGNSCRSKRDGEKQGIELRLRGGREEGGNQDRGCPAARGWPGRPGTVGWALKEAGEGAAGDSMQERAGGGWTLNVKSDWNREDAGDA